MNTNFGDRREPKKEVDSLANEVHRISRGKINCSFEFQPENSGTTTVIFHPNIGVNSFIALYPLTSAAANDFAKTWEDRSVRSPGTCTINHPDYAGDSSDALYMGIVIG